MYGFCLRFKVRPHENRGLIEGIERPDRGARFYLPCSYQRTQTHYGFTVKYSLAVDKRDFFLLIFESSRALRVSHVSVLSQRHVRSLTRPRPGTRDRPRSPEPRLAALRYTVPELQHAPATLSLATTPPPRARARAAGRRVLFCAPHYYVYASFHI